MIFDFVNNSSTRLSFNTDLIPLNNVEFEYDTRNNRRPKMQRHGKWPGFTYVDECLVHMSGQVFGSSPSDFDARKQSIANTILGNLTTFPVSQTKLGRLEIQTWSMTEMAYGDCTIDGDISMPVEGLSPQRCPIQITWVVFAGYFTGITSGNPYIIK